VVPAERMDQRTAGERGRRLPERGHRLLDRHLEADLLLGRQLAVLALEQRETGNRRHQV
jgi:hypothetical protein